MREFEIVVVGAGTAGTTAATFAARLGRTVAVVERLGAGGQIVNATRVENIPGFPDGIAGIEFGPLLHEQAEAAGAELMLDEVEGISLEGDRRIVRCAGETLSARAVIVAAGSTLRTLGIPGERDFFGKGVSYCASCDGPFFKGRSVCVVGGGDSAIDEALVLADVAERVTVLHRGRALDAQRALVERAEARPAIEIACSQAVEEIVGDATVGGVRVRDTATGATQIRPFAGVFIFVGLEPNTAFLRGVVALDAAGHVETDILMRTSVEGVFAAGDIRKDSVAQCVAAAGDGATAAIAAHRYLTGLDR